MKKTAALCLALLLLLSLAACGEKETAENPRIRIGVYEPLSGTDALAGKQEYLGMLYARDKSNSITLNGKEYDIELYVVDHGSTAQSMTEAAQKLVDAGVSLVLGSCRSEANLAVEEIFKTSGLPVIGTSCTSPSVTRGKDHYFRLCPDDTRQGGLLAAFARKKIGSGTVYCLAEEDNVYSQGLMTAFQQAAEKEGLRVISASYPAAVSNYSNYLEQAKAENAEMMFAPLTLDDALNLIRQAGNMGFYLPILGGDTWDSPLVWEEAQDTKLQLYTSAFYVEGRNSALEQDFKNWLSENPDALVNNGGSDSVYAYHVLGIDAYDLALTAIQAADSPDSAAIMAALPGVNYTGISGAIAFDENGDAQRDSCYIKKAHTENGSWTVEQKVKLK